MWFKHLQNMVTHNIKDKKHAFLILHIKFQKNSEITATAQKSKSGTSWTNSNVLSSDSRSAEKRKASSLI